MTDLTPVIISPNYKTVMEGHFGQYDSLLELNQKEQKDVLVFDKILENHKNIVIFKCSDFL